ncbi:MAG: glycine cleavage system protein GcvH [Leptospiraceae bacterium]|nr:glycine cleavage system protein GcvH [Leptospiraceae bacterium]
MSSIPDDLKYTREHEWVRVEGQTVVVGITDYAQNSLGDVVYVDGLENGQELKSGATIASIESVKAVSDIYSPVTGKITEINDAIANDPAIINKDPYGEGWLFKASIGDAASFEELLDAAAYGEFVATL